MNNPIGRNQFVDALLAHETGVSEEQYAAHRRRLDERLGVISPAGQFRWMSRGRIAVAAVLLLGLGVGGVLALRGLRPARLQADDLVVLRADADAAVKRRARTPYELTAEASLVVLASAKPDVNHRGRQVVPLRIDRVLKDETKQATPDFCCSYSGPEPAAQLLPAETRVIVYVTHSREEGWSLLELQPADARFEQRVLPGIVRCVEVLNAPRCEDPAKQYARLLDPAAGGLDPPASCALLCQPDPRSADVLLGQLKTLHTDLAGDGRATDVVVSRLGRLAAVLAKMHEGRAAVPVAECARRLPRGRRAELYTLLPALCRDALAPAPVPSPVLTGVRQVLSDEIKDRAANAIDFQAAVTALANLDKDAPDK